jgi:hypothetical protein
MPYQLTQEKFVELLKAQAQCASELLSSEHWLYSDDGMDYVAAACNLFASMVRSYREAFEKELNTKGAIIDNYACDGIANIFFKLGVPAMDSEDE